MPSPEVEKEMSVVEKIIVSKNVALNNSFLNCKKFEQSGCNSIKCIVENQSKDGIKYFRNDLIVDEFENFLKRRKDPGFHKDSILATGINLVEVDFSKLKIFEIPLFLIPDEKCFINLIEFDVSKEPPNFKAICDKSTSCDNNKNFCDQLQISGSNVNIKAREIANLINRVTENPIGYIPFMKSSLFLDYLIWKSNFKKILDYHLKDALSWYNRRLENITPP